MNLWQQLCLAILRERPIARLRRTVAAMAAFSGTFLSLFSAVCADEQIGDRWVATWGASPSFISQSTTKGLYIYGGTLTPFHGSIYDPLDALRSDRELLRQTVNNWIRTSREFDAVIDFDAAVRDPAAPVQLLGAYDSGDHIHPNSTGYQAMANAVSLSLFGL